MRVDNAVERQLIVADEELSSLEDVVCLQPAAQYLNVSFNRLRHLSGLERLRGLRSLNVSHNALASLPELTTLSNLLVLNCSSNEIVDLRWITVLSSLQELWIRDNRVESAQLPHLQSLPALQTLVVHPNPCTKPADYISTIVKLLPWLQRIDTVIVTEELRMEARHFEERLELASVATDCSLPSLSGRSEVSCCDIPATPEAAAPVAMLMPSPQPIRPAKSKKQLAVEEFMRNFPVQDFIPVGGDGAPVAVDNQATDSDLPEPEVTSDPSSPQLAPIDSEGAQGLTEERKHSPERPVRASHHVLLPETESTLESGGISALLSSVLTLPTFEGDSFLKKKPKKTQVPGKSKPRRQSQTNGGSSQPFHQSEEFSVSYLNSTVTAVQVRCDGSAIARWPTGSVAVSVDPDAGGFRVYAAHKNGQLALSFDAAGVGFLNDYPSGKTLISTTSSGDGLLFDVSSGGILRQWDSHGRLQDGACQAIDSLGDESDGSLLCRFNEHLAVRIQLTQQQTEQSEDLALSQKASPSNPLLVHIYFAAPPSIRHVFVNRANLADAADGDCCDYALGKDLGVVDKSRAVKTKPPPVQHLDLLDSIRAAVAGL